MNDDFDRSLKEFSEKHGAVLLGMHKDLQIMHESIEKSEQELKKAKELRVKTEKTFNAQKAEIQNAMTETNNRVSRHFQHLASKQIEVQKLYDKSLELLTEHKQREIAHQLKVEEFNRKTRKIVIGALISVAALLALVGWKLWIH